MLVDVVVAQGFNPQIVAGQLEKHVGMTSITVFWDAGVVRGDIGDADFELLGEFPGVESVAESDGAEISSAIAPVIKAGDVNLGLSDPASLLTGPERLALECDIASIVVGRRRAWAQVADIHVF
jgi:hypothetical protein